jgi:hypothetical protein
MGHFESVLLKKTRLQQLWMTKENIHAGHCIFESSLRIDVVEERKWRAKGGWTVCGW